MCHSNLRFFNYLLISLKSLGNSYTKFAILDIKFPFTCGRPALKYSKVPKYYDQDCRWLDLVQESVFPLVIMFMTVKNTRILSLSLLLTPYPYPPCWPSKPYFQHDHQSFQLKLQFPPHLTFYQYQNKAFFWNDVEIVYHSTKC